MENLEETQKTIETVVNKYRLVPFLRERAKSISIPLEDSLEQAIAVDILAHMMFYKRTTPDVLIGLLYKRFSNVELCLKVLDTLIGADLLDYDHNDNRIITRYTLLNSDTDLVNQMMYPPPMVIPPKKVMRNTDTGYHFSPRSSIVLRNSFYAGNTNLEHINRVNSIPLRLNTYVVSNRKHEPKNELKSVKDRINWNKYVTIQSTLTDYYKDRTFYLTHKYDKRGRVYCQGYHISYQSDDFTNSLVEFANGEKVI